MDGRRHVPDPRGVTVISAVGAITFRNPVYCAIWFGLSLLGVAGLFFFAGAQFLAVATVVVYAGAILVTFLFVLMLAQPEGKASYDRVSWEASISAVAGMMIVGVLSISIGGVFSRLRSMLGTRRFRQNVAQLQSRWRKRPPSTEEAIGREYPHAAARGPIRRRGVRPALDRRGSGGNAAVGRAGRRSRDCGRGSKGLGIRD